ncbi:MAG: hypothetical protein M3N10_06040 [Actinomycetota bacterium]|nr:hypothetical protein [Actinomycetota bacterium]
MESGKSDEKRAESGPIAPSWWPVVAVIPIVAGMLWMWFAVKGGVLGELLSAGPGTLLLATGLSNLLWAGDARIFHFMSFGAVLGMLLSLPTTLVSGPWAALLLLAGSVASYPAAGYLALGQEPVPPEAPEPHLDLKQSYMAAGDEFSMCTIVLTTWPLWVGPRAARIGHEMDEALEMFEENGWLAHPASYHEAPPYIEKPDTEPLRYKTWSFQRLSFESGYEPHPDEPGRDRWLSYESNRTAHAWVMQHPGEPRPWLVGLHGIRMGFARGDLLLYRPEHLYHQLGLNLLVPILPIHGPRKVGPVSGDRILSGDVMDTIHAGAQAIWDIRRLLSWVRSQDAPAVGVVGYSLGGYTAALLAGLENEVDCVISGNPAVDPSELFWRNALSLTVRYLKTEGVTEEKMDALMRPVAPLALPPRITHEQRAIFCGVADRVVPASEAASLWRHWEEPRIHWYQGSHRGFLRTAEGEKFIEDTLRTTGVLVDR